MLYALGLWFALAPITLLVVWTVVYRPPRMMRNDRGAVVHPWRRTSPRQTP